MTEGKGFTLIELLVAITIIGIIMIMTLPAIRNIQRENEKKKFDDYERAVLEAAKAYEDQYEEDLFGRSDTGCAYIDFDSLVQKKLLATTKISGYECKNSNNGIIIRKIKGTSYYEVYLTCDNGKPNGTKNLTGNNDNYNNIKTEHCNSGDDVDPPQLTIKCDGDGDEPAMGVQGDDFKDTKIYYYSVTNTRGQKKIPKLTAEIHDDIVGLEKNQYLTYEWKIYTDKRDQLETNPDYTEKNRTTFNAKDGTTSRTEKNIRIIEAFKEKDKTGKAIVDIRGTNIVDRIGNKLDPEESFKQCPYFYDNVKPEMEIKITGNTTGTNYNPYKGDWINEPITTTVTVTDKTQNNTNNIYSGIDMTTFNNSNVGGAKLSEKDEATATHTYQLVDTNRKEDDEYTVCDKVGNCISKTALIRVDTKYPVCKSRDGDPNWRNKNITIYGDCQDQGNPAHYSDCKQKVYKTTYSNEQSITNATAGEACDNAGNCVICSEDQSVHIDKTRPGCPTEGESTEWAQSRTIKFNCEDPISGGVRSNCTQKTYETITYTSTTKTTSKTWNVKDNAGNTRTCTNSKVNVYMDNTDPICSHSVSGENSPGNLVKITFTCNEPDGEIGSVVTAHYVNGGFGDEPITPGGGSFSSPYSLSRSYNEGAYGFICRNKAGGVCTYAPEVEKSECRSECCGTHDCGGCDQNGNNCKQCPNKCTLAKCCGYHVK
ncbi:MAG: prepilin-type N-terminal cleavage/methylation domain-containing protein [Bacilli bacterium]|nr:prepilin-type N-terminal cleavage/methylation domain-containing protein [Bacilli bacterium]